MRKMLVAILMVLPACGFASAAEYKIDVSLDTPPSHIRNLSFVEFAKEIGESSGGRIEMNIFHSASQFKGGNVAKALAQGALEMGAPAFHHLSKFVPDSGIVLLPIFYGASLKQIYAFSDGPMGQELYDRVEKKMGVKVLGRPLDLGYGTVFTGNKKLEKTTDMVGMKMRVPGGAATLERYRVLGASPVKIGLADLPQALQRGTVDGIWSTQETVRSSKLWDAGIKYAFDDKQSYVQYIPMINGKVWKSLPAELQKLMVDTWENTVEKVRILAKETQEKAQLINAENGIETVEPAAEDLQKMRQKLLASQPTLVEDLKMDADYVARVQAAVDAVK